LASSNVIEYFPAFHSKYRYVSCIVSSMSQFSVVYLPSISKPNGAVVSSGSLEYSSVSTPQLFAPHCTHYSNVSVSYCTLGRTLNDEKLWEHDLEPRLVFLDMEVGHVYRELGSFHGDISKHVAHL